MLGFIVGNGTRTQKVSAYLSCSLQVALKVRLEAYADDDVYVHDRATLECMLKLPRYRPRHNLECRRGTRPPENPSNLEIYQVAREEHGEQAVILRTE
jgi:hypothetical protein